MKQQTRPDNLSTLRKHKTKKNIQEYSLNIALFYAVTLFSHLKTQTLKKNGRQVSFTMNKYLVIGLSSH